MFLAVIVPTQARKKSVGETVESIVRQADIPDQIIVSASGPEDVDPDLAKNPRVQLVFGPRGITLQRNRGIDALNPKAEIVCMLDDDVELPEDYFSCVKRLLETRPEIVGFSGSVMTVDHKTREEAKKILLQWKGEDRFEEGKIGIGCSMNVRRWVLEKVRFDERLALYGRLEDADFAARTFPLGKQGTYFACRVAHLMEKQGRLPGKAYGFSQVMNPYYLWRKGSMPSFWEVVRAHWWIALGSNTWGMVRPRRPIDHWGRLRGNFLALWFILRGRIEPEYIEKI
jgi:glycosyltransferase involved in cell wall biosynthesis